MTSNKKAPSPNNKRWRGENDFIIIKTFLKGNRSSLFFLPVNPIFAEKKAIRPLTNSMQLPRKILIELQYLPPLQFFSKFLLHEVVCLEQCENYQKRSYRNRCHLAGPNGLLRLSVPLRGGKNEQQPIREVAIANKDPWQQQHWQSIQTAYGNAPFFEFYADTLRPFYERRYEKLFDFDRDLLKWLLGLLDLPARLQWSRSYERTTEADTLDFRNTMRPKKQAALADPHFTPRPYRQVFEEKNGFLPNLSILDLLFCSGPQAPLILKECVS